MVGDDDSRLIELRRRVQADPASIAFAQLAEEYRRAGDNEEAVRVCRAGLHHHPNYPSARVTLGRALLELGQLDDAQRELDAVLTSAPDNLAALRTIAEVYQHRGQMDAALEHYRRALSLARHDTALEHAVQRMTHAATPPRPPAPIAPAAVAELFDFDTLLEQLGGASTPPEPPAANPAGVAVPSVLQSVVLEPDASDPFSRLEQQLRESESQKMVLNELEAWLASIIADRTHSG